MFSLSRLLPREDKFYGFIKELAAHAQSVSTELHAFVATKDPAEQARAGAAITKGRLAAKAVMENVTRELSLSFITPFDREDIQDFSFSLYKISKIIDKVRERLALYDMVTDRGDFTRQLDLILQEAQAMQEMVDFLIKKGDHTKEIIVKAELLSDLENKGDVVLGELLASLMRDTSDVRDLLVRKDIYDMLEKVLDRYRDAAAVALQIVLKHS